MALNCNFVGWMENAECGVRGMGNEECAKNEEYGKCRAYGKCGVLKMRSMENAECVEMQ